MECPRPALAPAAPSGVRRGPLSGGSLRSPRPPALGSRCAWRAASPGRSRALLPCSGLVAREWELTWGAERPPRPWCFPPPPGEGATLGEGLSPAAAALRGFEHRVTVNGAAWGHHLRALDKPCGPTSPSGSVPPPPTGGRTWSLNQISPSQSLLCGHRDVILRPPHARRELR